MAPDAGVAVGLQFHPHRQFVGLRCDARDRACCDAPGRDAEQRLDVMTDLVRDHVGLREVARRAEALVELAEERQIEIELVIGRAIERPAAADEPPHADCTAVEQHEDRLLVGGPPPGKSRQVSSVSPSTTATNCASGSLRRRPVGLVGLLRRYLLAICRSSSGLRPLINDTASTMMSIPMPPPPIMPMPMPRRSSTLVLRRPLSHLMP